MTYVMLPEKEERWRYEGNAALIEWKPSTESDETGFRKMIVENLEDAEDVMGEISIEDITKNMPRLAKAVKFDSAGGGCELLKKMKERLEAKKRLRGKDGELKVAKRDFAKQRTPRKGGRKEPGESFKRCRKWRTSMLAFKHFLVKMKEKQQVTVKNGRRRSKDTRGTSIRMRTWEWRRGKNLMNGRRKAEGTRKKIETIRYQDWLCPLSCKAELRFQMRRRWELMASQLRFSNPYLGELCRKAFEMRYKGRYKESFDAGLRNICVLFSKKKKKNHRLEGQTRGICVQSVLAKWYCGCLTIFLDVERRNMEKREQGVGEYPHLWFWGRQKCNWDLHGHQTHGGGCKRLVTRTWAHCLLHWCEASLWQCLSQKSDSGDEGMSIALVLAGVIRVEQVGGKYDICFPETRTLGIHFDKFSNREETKVRACSTWAWGTFSDHCKKMECFQDGSQDEE